MAGAENPVVAAAVLRRREGTCFSSRATTK
jgi:hypothetical protein